MWYGREVWVTEWEIGRSVECFFRKAGDRRVKWVKQAARKVVKHTSQNGVSDYLVIWPPSSDHLTTVIWSSCHLHLIISPPLSDHLTTVIWSSDHHYLIILQFDWQLHVRPYRPHTSDFAFAYESYICLWEWMGVWVEAMFSKYGLEAMIYCTQYIQRHICKV